MGRLGVHVPCCNAACQGEAHRLLADGEADAHAHETEQGTWCQACRDTAAGAQSGAGRG